MAPSAWATGTRKLSRRDGAGLAQEPQVLPAAGSTMLLRQHS